MTTITIALTPWRIFGALLTALTLITIGAWGGHTLARNHYEPLLTEANKQIGTLTTTNAAMKSSLEWQNAAVTALETEAKKREQDAAQAVNQARQQSAKSQTRAQAVMISKPPAGQNACEAAQKAFDAELRAERIAK